MQCCFGKYRGLSNSSTPRLLHLLWKFDWSEPVPGIEIVLTTFVDDAEKIVGGSSFIRQYGINLVKLKCSWISGVIDADHELSMTTSSLHHLIKIPFPPNFLPAYSVG